MTFGRPGCGAPVRTRSGRLRTTLVGNPEIRFQNNESVQKTIYNTIRYQTSREDRDQYKHDLGTLMYFLHFDVFILVLWCIFLVLWCISLGTLMYLFWYFNVVFLVLWCISFSTLMNLFGTLLYFKGNSKYYKYVGRLMYVFMNTSPKDILQNWLNCFDLPS